VDARLVAARRGSSRLGDPGAAPETGWNGIESAWYINWIFVREYMPKISVEIPAELLADLDDHVGDDGKFVNRSDAVRASIRKTLDMLDEIDARHGRIDDE